MSWARGVNEHGRAVGYAIEAKCDLPGCEVDVDRGLSHRCGGVHNLHDDYGCGGFFCSAHLYSGSKDLLCEKCIESDPIDDEEDDDE